jgi:DUF1680 family protein
VKGDAFFYQNPLESTGRNERSAYFDVACCPANLARAIAQLPGLIYARQGDTVFVNLFVESDVDLVVSGANVHIKQTTNYPWDGDVRFTITTDKAIRLALRIRIPGWTGSSVFGTDLYTLSTLTTEKPTVMSYDSGFTELKPGWFGLEGVAVTPRGPAPVRVHLPMPVRRVLANAGIKDDVGKAAIQRGPLVYALEAVDNGGKALDITLPLDTTFAATPRADLLGGVTTLTATVPATGADGSKIMRTVTAIPYYAWANRGRGEMVVWPRYQ